MFARKTWLLRFSVCLNVLVVLLYVGPHLANRADLLEEVPASARAAAISAGQLAQQTEAGGGPSEAEGSTSQQQQQSSPQQPPPQFQPQQPLGPGPDLRSPGGGAEAGGPPPPDSGMAQPPPPAVPAPAVPAEPGPAPSAAPEPDASTRRPATSTPEAGADERPQETAEVAAAAGTGGSLRSLEEAVPCHDRELEPRTAQRSDFWVLYNYVRARRRFHCWQSITYTTHADYTFLDNLEPLLDRWRGPVSLAMHAPGTDFKPTLDSIRWARECGSPLIADLVTFHVYFGTHHVPKEVPRPERALTAGLAPNCSAPPPWTNATAALLYKTRSRLLYPVNVGRNVARESATTHYLLPSDIELYPSPGTIDAFLEMVRRDDPPLRRPGLKVFPLSIFELEKGSPLPENKTQLVSMFKNGTAIPFHKKLCHGCHSVPHSKEWQAANVSEGLHVFHIGKRIGYHVHWEPIFIGTHQDPLYDERLSWEGKSDKMTQGYAMCVLDYEFHILDNAFLVHKPGIKTLKIDRQRALLTSKTNNLIKKVIFPELKVLYGVRKGCAV